MFQKLIISSFFVFFATIIQLLAQSEAPDMSFKIDEERDSLISEIGSTDIPDPEKITRTAQEIFAKDISDQSVSELESLAKIANKYANLFGYIEEELSSYRRSNLRYDFVLDKIRGPLLAQQAHTNKFKTIRNRSYFNLGIKALASGERLKAFFFFRDAHRLSNYTCSDGQNKCLRLDAELYMKSILNADDIPSYVHWE